MLLHNKIIIIYYYYVVVVVVVVVNVLLLFLLCSREYDDEKNMDVVTKQAGTTSVVGETILHKVQYTKETTARFVWR